ncbi:unnamed protein product, partial [Brassica rapa subsp. trilocularis]
PQDQVPLGSQSRAILETNSSYYLHWVHSSSLCTSTSTLLEGRTIQCNALCNLKKLIQGRKDHSQLELQIHGFHDCFQDLRVIAL